MRCDLLFKIPIEFSVEVVTQCHMNAVPYTVPRYINAAPLTVHLCNAVNGTILKTVLNWSLAKKLLSA